MAMNKSHRDFENFLRDFHPRPPRALPEFPVEKPWQWRRLAAAVIIAITCGGAVRFSASRYRPSSTSATRQATNGPPSASVPAQIFSRAELRRLALEDPAKFDALLFSIAPNSLPSFTEPTSLLRVLAQD
jgi:hypothetical protein